MLEKLRCAAIGLAVLGVATGGSAEAGEALDEALYARLLLRHTRETRDLARTRVDYAGLKRSAEWQRLIANLRGTDPADLSSPEQQLAYWFNVYNILAIDRVLQGYPLESIRDLGSLFSPVWKHEAGQLSGRAVTLHEIEHEILRPLGEPRIHVAIVCASLSCPALLREPWTADRVDEQLDGALRRWMSDPRKGLATDTAAGSLRISKIFDWFEQDFGASGGVLAFVSRYAAPEQQAWLERHGRSARLTYFDYDWRLNDLATARLADLVDSAGDLAAPGTGG